MSKKPSLTDFMQRPALSLHGSPAPAPARAPAKEVKNLTLRASVPQWAAMVSLTTAERLKLQEYILGLIADDFKRRGLRWPD